nr:MAG TPA: hypothetical protein [Caudoviricetes sp.]
MSWGYFWRYSWRYLKYESCEILDTVGDTLLNDFNAKIIYDISLSVVFFTVFIGIYGGILRCIFIVGKE